MKGSLSFREECWGSAYRKQVYFMKTTKVCLQIIIDLCVFPLYTSICYHNCINWARLLLSYPCSPSGRFYYERLITYMQSSDINGLILGGEDAIKRWRRLMGPTKPYMWEYSKTCVLKYAAVILIELKEMLHLVLGEDLDSVTLKIVFMGRTALRMLLKKLVLFFQTLAVKNG